MFKRLFLKLWIRTKLKEFDVAVENKDHMLHRESMYNGITLDESRQRVLGIRPDASEGMADKYLEAFKELRSLVHNSRTFISKGPEFEAIAESTTDKAIEKAEDNLRKFCQRIDVHPFYSFTGVDDEYIECLLPERLVDKVVLKDLNELYKLRLQAVSSLKEFKYVKYTSVIPKYKETVLKLIKEMI